MTAVTSDIRHTGKNNDPFVTTLYQNAFAGKPESEPSFVDGNEDKSFPSETTLPPGRPHWLLDNKGTGYYVHPCEAPLIVSRHPQTWSYFGRATSNRFALAYVAHGHGPRVPGCVYTILVRSNTKEMAAFSKAMESVETAAYREIQLDSSAHILWDRETKTAGYVLFAGSSWTPPRVKSDPRTAKLLSASRPCMVMIRESGDKLKISVASTDWKDPSPLVLAIQGEWKLEGIDTAQPCKTAVEGGSTRLEISYEFDKPAMGYMPIRAILGK